jgi:thiamine pyrophosphokinase
MVAEGWPVEQLDEEACVVVVANGDPLDPRLVAHVPTGALVVAADGGARLARRAGLRVAHVVGDFDSLEATDRRELELEGAELHPYPADKDFTDLELAIDLAHSIAATARAPRRLLVLGGAGGRLDHFVANVALLAAPVWLEAEPVVAVEAWLGTARLTVAIGGAPALPVPGAVGSLVSLLPQHGPATGVVTEGLRFPLRHETLRPGSSRGVSNVVAGPGSSVSVEQGVLLVVQPFHFAPPEELP